MLGGERGGPWNMGERSVASIIHTSGGKFGGFLNRGKENKKTRLESVITNTPSRKN